MDVAALAAALRALAAALEAPGLAAAPPDELVDATTSPLGSPWTFRRMAREGAFPTFRAGRRLVARRADVLAAIERQPARRPAKGDPMPAPTWFTAGQRRAQG